MMLHSSQFRISVAVLLLAGGPVLADTCVVNGSDESYLFVAEVRGSARETGTLAPGERLCAPGTGAGVVSVFRSAEEFEGCSRLLAAPGGDKVLLAYSDFDRCTWDDHGRTASAN